ncbi:TPA: hypothetical protein ACQ84E_002018 [Klebsiella pneumoniae]
MMGIVLISSSRADVLNYAREWTSRNDEKKAITSPSQPQAEEEKSSAPRQKSAVQRSLPGKEKSKASPPAATRKKRVPPAVAADKRMTSPAIKPSKPTDKQAPTVVEDRDKLVAGAGKNPSLADP